MQLNIDFSCSWISYFLPFQTFQKRKKKFMDLSLCNYTLTFHVHGYHISCLSKLIKKKKKKFLAFSKTFLQVHFGVNSGATRFAIEHQAVNEATFRCPDEMGWKPQVRIPSPKKWELKTLSSTYQFLFM